ncbi:Zinc finger, RING-type [Corchorus capsularis]|uniref:Zinc finger, RING-type n=1 Tax=Corchorus capsularis TaxID=210143 RepID=A0A1R3JGF3_COCAP|nr:Zinc finger, RING-type [Corchorus capsularis]
MASSNSNHHPYKIYVSAEPYNYFKDDNSLESPLMGFRCFITMTYFPDKPLDKSLKRYIQAHNSLHEFKNPADKLTAEFISSNMFSNNTIIPFSLTNLHWKNKITDKDSVPDMSVDGVVTLTLGACNEMIGKSRESGRKKLLMHINVKKEVIVPHDEYIAMLKAKEAEEKRQEVLQQVETMVRLRGQSWNFSRSEREAMDNAIREVGLGNSISDALNLLAQRAIRESGRAQQVKWVPAASTAIQGLEVKKMTAAGAGGGGDDQEQCVFCMKRMVMGSEVISLPCSHVFHRGCIVRWLNTSHTCPICRFKLPTS